MKSKLLLPMLAILLAVGSAFTPVLDAQRGWFRTGVGNQVLEGDITTPSDTDVEPCTFEGEHTCLIGNKAAYATEVAAQNQVGTLMYKYD
ncbi:MAG: hypothetical protein J0L67_04080 [Cytophagales bacterium]|nr:hypothetical protein [Cytophagales bacterium]